MGERSEIELVGGKMWWFGALKKRPAVRSGGGAQPRAPKTRFF